MAKDERSLRNRYRLATRQISKGTAGAFKSLTICCATLLVALLFCATAADAQKRQPVNVILDTDMASDVDDVGALATLLSLEDLGEAKILAVGVCVLNDWSILGVDAITTYYGRPDISLGTAKTGTVAGSRYAQQIATEYPRSRGWNTADDAPEVIGVYRRVLSQQPDNSVTFVTIGPVTSAAELLKSAPCQHSDLNGRDLVAKKVRRWVGMGGNHNEYNMTADAPASKYALDSPSKWPAPVLFSPHGVGTRVRTGEGLRYLPENNILRRAWDLYKGKAKDWNHPSYDQCAVHYAVRGFDGGPAEDYYDLVGPGWYRIDDSKDDSRHGYVGYTGFDLDPDGLHKHKKQADDAFDRNRIAAELYELMKHNPNGRDPEDPTIPPAAPSSLPQGDCSTLGNRQ